MLAKLFSFWNSPTGRISIPLFLVLSLLTRLPANSVRRLYADEYRRTDERRGHLRFWPPTVPLQNGSCHLRHHRRRNPCATCTPGTMRSRSGMLVAPERRINATSWAVSIPGVQIRVLGDFRVFAEYSTEGGVPRPAALWRKTAGTFCTAGFEPILRSPRFSLSAGGALYRA